MSNRSPIELLAAGGLFADAVDGAEEKSPKSAPKLLLGCRVVGCCTGGEICFGGGAGLASKKPPPDNGGGDFTWDACLEWPLGGAKLENGVGFC